MILFHPFPLLLATVLWWVISYIHTRREENRISEAHGCKEPPLRPDNILGTRAVRAIVTAFRENRFPPYYVEAFNKYGRTHRMRRLNNLSIMTCEPENIEAVLSSNFEDYGLKGARKGFRALMGDGIFTTDGAQWAHSRTFLRPSFSRQTYTSFSSLEGHIKKMLQSMFIPDDGKEVEIDLFPHFMALTLGTETELLLGRDVSMLVKEKEASLKDSMTFSEAFAIAQEGLQDRARLAGLYWMATSRRFRQACSLIHSTVDEVISEAVSERTRSSQKTTDDSARVSFLDSLLDETSDRKAIRYQLTSVLVAGRDTTAALLSWTFYLLARRPDVLSRLQKEILEQVGLGVSTRSPSYQDLQKLKYLKMVLNETLRLFPGLPINTKEAVRTTVLPRGGGDDGRSPVLVRKGQRVAYTAFVAQRLPEYYGPDPNEFRPERWDLDTEEGQRLRKIKWAYFPFNGGPRACPGKHRALTNVSFTVVYLLQRISQLKVTSEEERPIDQDGMYAIGLGMYPGNGVKVHISMELQSL